MKEQTRKWTLLVAIIIASTITMMSSVENLNAATSGTLVNINTATTDELTTLPGIGSSKAAAIISHRAKVKFKQVADVQQVKGIGKKLFSKIKHLITVGRVSFHRGLDAPLPGA